MPIWKASRSDSRIAASSRSELTTTRPVSWALSRKCLIVETTPSDWMPAIECAGDDAGQQRVLRNVFEVAAAARLTHQVGAAAEHDVEALGARFPPDQRAGGAGGLGIEGGAEQQRRRERRRLVAGPDVAGVGDAEAGIGLLHRRDAEPRDGRVVCGGPERALGLRAAVHRQRDRPRDPGVFLVLRHRRDHHGGARVGRQAAIDPWMMLGEVRHWLIGGCVRVWRKHIGRRCEGLHAHPDTMRCRHLGADGLKYSE